MSVEVERQGLRRREDDCAIARTQRDVREELDCIAAHSFFERLGERRVFRRSDGGNELTQRIYSRFRVPGEVVVPLTGIRELFVENVDDTSLRGIQRIDGCYRFSDRIVSASSRVGSGVCRRDIEDETALVRIIDERLLRRFAVDGDGDLLTGDAVRTVESTRILSGVAVICKRQRHKAILALRSRIKVNSVDAERKLRTNLNRPSPGCIKHVSVIIRNISWIPRL